MAVLKFKRSVSAGNTPSLIIGEIGINHADRRLYVLDSNSNLTFINLTSDTEKAASGPIADSIATRVSKAGDTMTGSLLLNADPTSDMMAVNKRFVDALPAKDSVRLATTADLGNAGATTNTLTGKSATYTTSGTLTSGSTSVTGVANAQQAISVGASVTGTGIQASTTVAAVSGTTVTLSLAANASGTNSLTYTQTIAALSLDGFTAANNDRILVKNQATNPQNGLYIVSNAGSSSVPWVLTRSIDGDTWIDLVQAEVSVEFGALLNNSTWVCAIQGGGTLGTTAITWRLSSNYQTNAFGTVAANGIVVRNAANSAAIRSIAVTAGTGLTITNGDGVAGNPTLATNASSSTGASTLVLRDANGGAVFGNALGVSPTSGAGILTISGASSNPAIEIGLQNGTASTPYIDFHSGATAIDYDTRIMASGGNGTVGQGTLTVTAATISMSGNLTIGDTVAQYPTGLFVRPSAHAASGSKRAAMSIDNWSWLQDTAGNGTKNTAFYNAATSRSAITVSTADVTTFFTRPIFGSATPWDNANLTIATNPQALAGTDNASIITPASLKYVHGTLSRTRFSFADTNLTANQTTFTVPGGYTVGFVQVFLNGQHLVLTNEFTASNGTTVVLAAGRVFDSNTIIEIIAETRAY